MDEMTAGAEGALREIKASYEALVQADLRKIHYAIGSGDLSAARRYAHTLMGMAGNCAAMRIAVLARELETEARTLEAAREKTARLERAIEDTRQWLDGIAS